MSGGLWAALGGAADNYLTQRERQHEEEALRKKAEFEASLKHHYWQQESAVEHQRAMEIEGLKAQTDLDVANIGAYGRGFGSYGKGPTTNKKFLEQQLKQADAEAQQWSENINSYGCNMPGKENDAWCAEARRRQTEAQRIALGVANRIQELENAEKFGYSGGSGSLGSGRAGPSSGGAGSGGTGYGYNLFNRPGVGVTGEVGPRKSKAQTYKNIGGIGPTKTNAGLMDIQNIAVGKDGTIVNRTAETLIREENAGKGLPLLKTGARTEDFIDELSGVDWRKSIYGTPSESDNGLLEQDADSAKYPIEIYKKEDVGDYGSRLETLGRKGLQWTAEKAANIGDWLLNAPAEAILGAGEKVKAAIDVARESVGDEWRAAHLQKINEIIDQIRQVKESTQYNDQQKRAWESVLRNKLRKEVEIYTNEIGEPPPGIK